MKIKIQIQKTKDFIRSKFEQESSGHDWWHIFRVWQLATEIGIAEKANLYLVEMAALLHDLDDWKLKGSQHETCPQASRWLQEIGVDDKNRLEIVNIIRQVSFKGAGVSTIPNTLEGKVVQDADRLDAMGAIGIARTFAYGGNKHRLIFDPEASPVFHADFESYQLNNGSTINHFYEKLLLLKDLMNTEKGKQMAKKRHQFMDGFLQQFFDEWKLKA